jgi:hypothetical protein
VRILSPIVHAQALLMAAFADERTAAMAVAATQSIVAILIALSSPSDLDTPILELSHARIRGDR